MRVLVTRPRPEAERTAGALRTMGHEAVVAPVLRIEVIQPSFGAGPFAGIVITSGNAVRALNDHPRKQEVIKLPLFAVGARSAAAAREIGFAEVISADGDMGDLAALLTKRFGGKDANLLYVAGEDRAGDLAAALASAGIHMEMIVVYRAVPDEKFPAALGSALAAGPLDAVLHYSRRSAEAFLTGAGNAGLTSAVLTLPHFCLSEDVAAPLASAGARNTMIAPHPDEASLLGLLRPV